MPAANYAIYDITTGLIRVVLSLDEEQIDIQPFGPNEAYTMVPEVINDVSHYIDSEGEAVERPTYSFDKTTIVADGVDEAVISGLPNPTTVVVNGVPYEVTDGTFELATIDSGVYTVVIAENFPFQKFRDEVTAS